MSDNTRTVRTATRTIFALLAALLCLRACGAHAETVVSPASFQSAIGKAKAGDVIRLAGGRYPPLILIDRSFAPRLTITSADPGRPAEFPTIKFTRSAGVAVNNVVVMDPAISPYGKLIVIHESSDIALSSVKAYGDAPGRLSKNGYGISFTKSRHLSFLNGEIAFLNRGMMVNTSQDIDISGNRIHDIQSDGADFAEVQRVKITGNRFSDFTPVAGDHPDAIQFWTISAKTPSTDIEIRENLIITEPGQIQPQGIFLTDQKGNMPYARVQIRDNILVGTSWNGIMLQNASDSAITGNKLFTHRGQPVTATRIRVVKVTGILSDNIAKGYVLGGDLDISQKRNTTRDEGETAARTATATWDQRWASGDSQHDRSVENGR